jgi:hypothetical protein
MRSPCVVSRYTLTASLECFQDVWEMEDLPLPNTRTLGLRARLCASIAKTADQSGARGRVNLPMFSQD